MTDYAEFDAALLALIGGGMRSFAALVAHLQSQAKAFCTDAKQELFRVVDRRLQSLRKKGKVAYDTKTGWRLVKA